MAKPPVIDFFDGDTGIARIAFNRPEVLNAIDIPTAQVFRDAVLRVTSLPGLRCVVLSGTGRAFVAGGDVASFQVEPAKVVDALLDALHPAVLALRACPAPVLG
jgi:2-(1,2-epoxy-1,2-dihydrophenyl)acetyl-CoA isomerase